MFFEQTAARLIAEGHDRKDVCSFMAMSCADLLTDQDCREICEAAIALVATEQREVVQQRWVKFQETRKGETPDEVLGSWKYLCATNWRKVRAQQMAHKHELKHPDFDLRVSSRGYCILAESDSWDYDGRDALCEHYQLDPAEAECMCSTLSTRRIDDEAVLGLLGDDRDQTYWIGLAFAPAYLVEAFFSSSDGFENTAAAFS